MRSRSLARALGGAALVLVSLAGCTSREDKLAERLAKSEEYLAERKIPEALIELRGALKLDPTSAQINHRIARVLERQGALPDALFFYQETHRLDPNDFDAALSLAKLQMFTDPEASKQLIDDVIAKEPRNVMAYVRRSEWSLARGDAAAALQAAMTATEIEPSHVLTRIQLGLVHRARIRELALKKEPIPDALYLEALAELDRAIAQIAKVPDEIDPDWVVRAWIERANVLATWPARQREASAGYRKAAEVARAWPEQEVRALDRAGDHARVTGDLELQRWALERRVEIAPGNIATWIELSKITDAADAPASSVMVRLIEQRSTDARAHAAYARDLSERGQRAAAISHLERVASSTEVPAIALGELSRLRLLAGEVEAAQAVIQRMEREFPGEPQTLYAAAELQIAVGKYGDAVKSLEQLSQRNDTAETHRMLAEAKLRAGDRAGALVAADRALALAPEPKPVELLLLRARALAAQRDWESAIQAFRRAEQAGGGRLPPPDALALARAFYQAGRVQGGRVYLEATLAQGQPSLEAVMLFARYEGARQPERARDLLEAALRGNPDDVRILNRLSQISLQLGRGDTALSRVDAALQQSPQSAPLHFLRARVRVALNQLPAATADARAALELKPDLPGGIDLLVRLLAVQGQIEQARAELDAQDKAGTLRPTSLLLLARLHLQPGGDENRAIALLEQILAGRSDAPGVKNDLAFLLAKRGTELERARRLAEEARAAMSENPQVADTLGYVYLKSNLPEAALDQFRAALDMVESDQPEWPTFQYHLGLALKALDRGAEAAQAFERALAAAVEFPEAEDTRRELGALREARATDG